MRSPRSWTPTKPAVFSPIDHRIAACDLRESIGFRSILLTGLYRFTLSHCGSRTPLPTLKPHLAASAPRLCTDCLLGFIGFGLSPNYIICTELAHLLLLIILSLQLRAYIYEGVLAIFARGKESTKMNLWGIKVTSC